MQILVIEDTPVTAKSIELKLTSEGHNVYVTSSGEEGLELVALYDHDLILLDLDLPGMSGLEVIQTLRQRKARTPIIVLTGVTDIDAKVQALSAGADDYLTKPFYKAELVARINAVVRRWQGYAQSILTTGAISLNLDTRRAEVAGQPVHLTPSEYRVLELLCLRKNTVLTKEMCLNHLYNGMSDPEIKIIDVFVCKLRKKIAAASGGDSQIETVWGGGYMMRDRPEERAAA
jgi:two-component system cell cycle response regulator CtrA